MKHIKKILIPAAIVGGITIVIAKLCKKDSAGSRKSSFAGKTKKTLMRLKKKW